MVAPSLPPPPLLCRRIAPAAASPCKEAIRTCQGEWKECFFPCYAEIEERKRIERDRGRETERERSRAGGRLARLQETNAHDERRRRPRLEKKSKIRSYFEVPKLKKKPGQEEQLLEEESSAAAVAVLSRDEEDSSDDDDEDDDDDLAAAAATAALFDATDSLDGHEEEVDLSDFDDDELFLDAAALGYELKDDADADSDYEDEGDGGGDDDARLARAVSRALAAAASASASSSSSSSPRTAGQQQNAPDVEAVLSAFDAAIDSWDLGGRGSSFDFDEKEDDQEDDISFLLDIEDDEEDESEDDDNGGASPSPSSESNPKKPLCARCFSLVNYGKVKNAAAEAALPAFDLAAVVGRKLALAKFRRQIVLVVVDVADFDGSLPRAELQAMLPPLDDFDGRGGGGGAGGGRGTPASPSAAPVSLVFAVNKADTLPSAATGTRVADWARRRAKAAGVRRPDAVHVVSSKRGTGVRQLLADLHSRLGGRGDVWVVGSQNAGKSSLLNAMKAEVAKWKGGGGGGSEKGKGKKGRGGEKKGGSSKGLGGYDLDVDIKDPITAAPLPGTTLGVLRVRGLLPRGCKMLDTPGAPSPRSVIAALPPASAAADAALILPRSRISPRTFRTSAGQSLLLGGLARVDVVEPPSGCGPTLYLTVWAAGPVGVHYGSTEAAARARASLVARGTLAPPTGNVEDEERRGRVAAAAAAFSAEGGGEAAEADAAASLRFDQALGLGGPLSPVDVPVSGDSWRRSSVDVAVAGLGWVSVALSGTAKLRVWVPRGVAVTVREALVPDLARELGRPGFNGTPIKEVGGGGGGGGGGAGKAKKRGGSGKKKKKN